MIPSITYRHVFALAKEGRDHPYKDEVCNQLSWESCQSIGLSTAFPYRSALRIP